MFVEKYIGITSINHDQNYNTLCQSLGIHANQIYLGLYFSEKNKDNISIIRKIQNAITIIKSYISVTPVLHICDVQQFTLDNVQSLLQSFSDVSHIQLNNITESNQDFYKEMSDFYTLIIPINNKNKKLIVQKILPKETRILIDFSEGRGKQSGYNEVIDIIDCAFNNSYFNIGLAGGYGPGNLLNYKRMCNKYSHSFSIDAQTNLYEGLFLSHEKVKRYIHEITQMRLGAYVNPR